MARNAPMTGTTMVRRSSSKRIVPVVNRTLGRSVRSDFKRGNPTRRPLRIPALLDFQLFSASTASAIPVE